MQVSSSISAPVLTSISAPVLTNNITQRDVTGGSGQPCSGGADSFKLRLGIATWTQTAKSRPEVYIDLYPDRPYHPRCSCCPFILESGAPELFGGFEASSKFKLTIIIHVPKISMASFVCYRLTIFSYPVTLLQMTTTISRPLHVDAAMQTDAHSFTITHLVSSLVSFISENPLITSSSWMQQCQQRT
jgi:hypothetical protein